MFNFNKWNISEPLELFLVKPDGTVVCQLNGIDESSASLTINLNNQYELAFDYFKYVDVDGQLVESNGYYDFSVEMEILVSNVGFFRMVQPPYKYDSSIDKVSISARSIDSVLENFDLNYFKINTGEKTSLEYLVEYEDGETEQLLDEYTGLPYDYIVFYNDFPTVLNELKNTYADGVYSDAEDVAELKKYLSLIPRLKHKFAKVNNTSTLVEYAIVDDSTGTITLQNFATRCTELITFYTKYGEQLSLMHIVLDRICNKNGQSANSFCHAWSIGEIDEELKHKRFQFDNDENVYSFLTQTLSQAANCVFMFDIMNMRISAKLIENIGSDSGVSISRKNLMNTLTINCDDEQLITRYEVSGGNDSDISSYNFGTNKIDDLSYFFNARNSQGKLIYVSDELATKYAKYIEDREKARPKYAEYTKQINQYTLDIDTIRLRVPNDILKTDYTTFKTEELEGLITTYNNTLAVLQTLYKEDYGADGLNQDGSISEQFIRTTPYWYDYYAYLEAIEQVRKALVDRLSTVVDEDELAEQIDAYKTEWSLYGTVELNAIQNSYTDKLQLCIDGQSIIPKHYYKNWSEMTSAERAVYSDDEATFNATIPTWKTLTDLQKAAYGNWEENYRYEAKQWSELSATEKAEYGGLEINYYYDVYYADYLNRKNCHSYYAELQETVDDLESDKAEITAKRTALVGLLSLEGYSHEALATLLGWGNATPDVQFTAKDIIVIKRLYIDNTYENDNILTTSIDDIVTSIEVAKELFEDATEQLSIVSQPQLTFETDIDNLLCLPEFKDYDFNPGNFILLEYYDDYYVKVRLSSITFNPCIPTEALSVSFTNYITSNAERTDLTSILGLSKGSGKSGGSGSSGKSNSGTDIDELSNTLIYKLLNSEEFGSRVTNVILDTIRVNQITAKYAKFDGLVNGTTTIDGQCITTGFIRDKTYQDLVTAGTVINGEITNTTGSIINLNDGKFNLAGKIKWDGETLSVVGSITALSGYLGTAESGFIIDSYGIYSGSKAEGNNGYLTLSNTDFTRSINGTSRTGLRFAVGANFGVDNTGVLYAGNAIISGNISASTGKIGGDTGWNITTNKIYTGTVDSGISSGDITLSSVDFTRSINNVSRTGLRFAVGANFGLSNTGVLYANNAIISGTITASSGYIGGTSNTNGWQITTGKIETQYTGTDSTTKYMGIGVNGTAWAFYAGASTSGGSDGIFRVGHTGVLYATGAQISGTITATAGTIGGCSISNGVLQIGSANITGTLTGKTISSSSISGTSISGGTISGATITSTYGSNTLTINGANINFNTTASTVNSYGINFSVSGSSKCGLYFSRELHGDGYHHVIDLNADWVNIDKLDAYVCTQYGSYKVPVGSSDDGDKYCNTIQTTSSGLRVYGSFGTDDGDQRNKTFAASSSDRRLKKNIKDTSVHALDILMQIKHKEFDWIDTGRHIDVGYIAQEMEEISDDLVIKPDSEEDSYGIDTFYLQGVMTKAMQEQQEMIESMQLKIQELERKIK